MKYAATIRVEFDADDREDADRIADQVIGSVDGLGNLVTGEVHRVAA